MAERESTGVKREREIEKEEILVSLPSEEEQVMKKLKTDFQDPSTLVSTSVSISKPTPTPTIIPTTIPIRPDTQNHSHTAEPAISRLGLLPQLPEMPPSLELVTGVKADLRATKGFIGQEEVGIIGYAGRKELAGIKGIIKQRFTDFMVYEVTPTGEIVRLVDITKPVEPDMSNGKDKHKGKDKSKGKGKGEEEDKAGDDMKISASEAEQERGNNSALYVNVAETTKAAALETIKNEATSTIPPTLANLATHPLWLDSTITTTLLTHFSESTVLALHSLLIEGRNPPPKQDSGWGSRPPRNEVKEDVAVVNEEEAAMNVEGGAGIEEQAEADGNGRSSASKIGRGAGQGRDRGKGRSRDGRDRNGRAGRGDRNGDDSSDWWQVATGPREVLSQVISDKEARAAAHKVIRELFKGEFETSAKDTTEGQRLSIKWATVMSKRRDERERGPRLPNYIHFTLHKTNRETQDCLSHLSRLLNVPSRDLAICGTKDKRAVTTQRVSLRRSGGMNLPGLWRLANGVKAGRRTDKSAITERGERGTRIGDLRYAEKGLELGLLKGNHFVITLRNVQAESQQAIDEMMESLRDHGFINFFGMQRFGTSTVPTHITGLYLLQQKWSLAIDSIFSLREGEHPDCVRARLAWLEDKDISRALQLMPRRAVAERSLWEYWNRGNRVEDKVGALGNIPRNLRTMYVHAYQSYIWNLVTSERIKISSTSPIVGDLVYLDRDQQDEDQMNEQPKRNSRGGGGGRQEREQDNSSSRPVKHITEEDLSKGEYTIFDVVLPMPGWDVEYPGGQIGELYKRLLIADGLDPGRMRREQREYSLPGSYRKIINKPTQVTWEHIRYTDPDLPLVQSDEDKILNLNPPVTDDPTGKFRALKVSLTLGTSSYATMALREITRTETATWHQIGLTMTNEDQAHKGSRGEAGEGEEDGEGEEEVDVLDA